MQEQAEWCQRNKDQNRLHTGGSCVAATLLFITSSESAYVYLCTHNACQFLCLAHTPAFGFSADLLISRAKWITSLAAECTSAKEHTSQGTFAMAAWRLAQRRLPNAPKKSDCTCLIGSEEWHSSVVVVKNWNIGALRRERWITKLESQHLTPVYCVFAAFFFFFYTINGKTANMKLPDNLFSVLPGILCKPGWYIVYRMRMSWSNWLWRNYGLTLVHIVCSTEMK